MELSIFTDGASRGNPGKAAYAYLIYDKEKLLERSADVIGIATNNEAEYRAVIEALVAAGRKHPKADVTVHSDSNLVMSQLGGQWKVKERGLQELYRRVRLAEKALGSVKYKYVPREHPIIQKADALANMALDATG
jgi:ribonuclease HI